MADNPENKGFTVVDRRVNLDDSEKTASASQPATAKTAAPSQGEQTVKGPGWEMHEEKNSSPDHLPPMDFTTFCLSLASSAIIHLGQSPYPETGQISRNLPLAKQTIDILALLEEKTRNNLTPDESKLLTTLLYDLRLRYVESGK